MLRQNVRRRRRKTVCDWWNTPKLGKLGKVLSRRYFRYAKEFSFDDRVAFVGPGKPAELMELLKKYGAVEAPPHGAYHFNMQYHGELIQLQLYVGSFARYEGKVLVVLPHRR